MSLKPTVEFRRRISLRLTAWYALLLSATLGALGVIFYENLEHSQVRSDHEWIRAKQAEYVAEYRAGGLEAVEKITHARRSALLVVRIADAANRTLFLNSPDEWTPAHTKALENAAATAKRKEWIDIAVPDGRTFELIRGLLPDDLRLEIGRSTIAREVMLQRIRRKALEVALPAIFLCLVGGAFLSHRALKPLRDLQATVQRILASGDFAVRLSPSRASNELADLVALFNTLLDRIEALIRGMRESLDHVAHDLRTPVTHLRGIAELALQDPRDTLRAQQALAECAEEADQLNRMLSTLMDISEAEHGAMQLKLERIDLGRLAEEVIDVYEHVAEEKEITLRLEAGASGPSSGDRTRLRQAVSNLVSNAIKYTPRGGAVILSTRREGAENHLVVQDNGVGIPAAELPRVWERLYRCDHSRSERGLGLGLSLVRAIAAAHHGRVIVESELGQGSTFTLALPAAAAG